MFVLLPPSEGKSVPQEGPAVKLDTLVLPKLKRARTEVLRALVAVSRGRRADALAALGLTEGLADELTHNRKLRTAPAARAADVYTGVLYDALDLPGMAESAPEVFAAADRSILIFSALWGVVRPSDLVPHYRCSGGTRLPEFGSVDTFWRRELRAQVDKLVGDELIVDLRSSAYTGMWRPGPNSVSVRVVQERVVDGVAKRTVISHFNKATKGQLVRALLLSGAEPKNAGEFAEGVAAVGFEIEAVPGTPGDAFDVVLRD